jgi:PAS domain S-box-containing protein
MQGIDIFSIDLAKRGAFFVQEGIDGVSKSESRLDSLKKERDRYVSLAFCWAEILLEIDLHFNIRYASGACQAYFGRSAEALAGTAFRDLIAPADVPLMHQFLKTLLKSGRLHDENIRIVDPGQHLRWMSISGHCYDPADGRIYIALRKSTPAAMAAALSYPRDAASGLFDGASFSELAADRLKKLEVAGEPAEVTLVSMPEMRALQERLGQKAGSSLMHAVGDVLKANSIGGDTAARIGDGQFSILHAAGSRVDDLVVQLEHLTRAADPTGEGLSIDTATLSTDVAGVSEEDLTKGLLYTLHRCGDKGGMNLRDMTANMGQLVQEAVREVNDFKKVIALAEFHVVVQPIIHVNTGEIHHYEALCRFERNAGESPFKTIVFAEETGLIHEFDLAMVKKVIEWLGKRPRNTDRYHVAVNVSGFSIGKRSYVDALLELLAANDWTRGKLMFEITESSRMSDLDAANHFIQALRERDYQVSLDDFGAGAASFQYLSVLDVDVVKLDGSAIKNAQRAPKGRAFLSALTELCRRMGIETIAEMVDTPETLSFVRECGCNYVQGYLFGRPSRDTMDFTPLPELQLFRRARPAVGMQNVRL